MSIFDRTNISLMNKALDAYALRQKVSAANIANITTPGYRSQSVAFEEQLAAAKNAGAFGGDAQEGIAEPTVHETSDLKPPGYNEMASGFNDVDIDYEMVELAKNQIRFKFGTRILADTFKGMQKAIRGTLS
jgi:flagellar basal-body rod protein FlgB